MQSKNFELEILNLNHASLQVAYYSTNKEHLEVWHEKEPDPKDARKKAKKRALIKKYSSSEVETLINQAKATKKTDYANRLDLAHRQQLNMDLNLSELGIEKGSINQILIKDAEIERNKLQNKKLHNKVEFI